VNITIQFPAPRTSDISVANVADVVVVAPAAELVAELPEVVTAIISRSRVVEVWPPVTLLHWHRRVILPVTRAEMAIQVLP
jgi:hypothetical protein